MKILSKEDIVNARDLKIEKVEIPEWEGIVCVRGLTGTERDDFEESIYLGKSGSQEMNFRNFRAKLVSLTMVDEEGNRLFSLDDVEELGKKSANALERIYRVAEKLSGFRKKDVDELTKNL